MSVSVEKTGMRANLQSSRRLRLLAVLTTLLGLSSFSGNAQVVRLLKNLSGETIPVRHDVVAIDDAGTNVYAVASTNQYGANATYRNQIFRWDTASGAGAQLTNFELGVETVSVSDDGQWLVFVSRGDLVGANHDESPEVFAMHPDGTGLSQVTNDTSRAGDGVATAIIAGSGNRIIFNSDTDPLGTNPGRTPHYFVVDRDGSNLVQLAAAYGPKDVPAISDDGTRVVYFINDPINYDTNSWIYASPADGSTLPVIIATVFGFTSNIAISGNGQVVVFEVGETVSGRVNYDGTVAIWDWATSLDPSITDDGLTAFFQTSYGTGLGEGVAKIPTDGFSGATFIVPAPVPRFFTNVLVSGDGSRIVAVVSGQTPISNDNDPRRDLVAMDASGGNLHQLTQLSVRPMSSQAPNYAGEPTGPRILTNGSRVYFVSDGDPLGTNADHSAELFTVLPGGTGLAQITNFTGAAVQTLSVSDAGVIVFESNGDLTAHNFCGVSQAFKINTSGTGLTQITDFCSGGLPFARFPIVRFDGQWVLYEFNDSFTNSFGLKKISINGGAATTVVQADTPSQIPLFHYRMSTVPISWIVYDAPGNMDAQNPNHRYQIQRIAFAGTSYLRITADPNYDSWFPDISGDGNKIVWYSQANFTGQNPGHDNEIFLYDAPTASIRQLTHATGGSGATMPGITRDGAWVYYNQADDVLRMSVATGEIQRVTGFSPYQATFADVDGTGAKSLFTGRDMIRQSPGWTSLFLSDLAAKRAFHVGKAAPTLLDWDPDPQSLTYDVIRGDLGNLAVIAGSVSLGAVTCLENDSPDNKTLGNEDAAQPAAGHGFFYLYRGTVGAPAVAASWGQGTGALERAPGAGVCVP